MTQTEPAKDYALRVAAALESQYPGVEGDVSRLIDADSRQLVHVALEALPVARLVWEIGKFIWVRKQQAPHIPDSTLEHEVAERFKGQREVPEGDFVGIVFTALEAARSLFF